MKYSFDLVEILGLVMGSGGISAIFMNFAMRRKNNADATKVITEAAIMLEQHTHTKYEVVSSTLQTMEGVVSYAKDRIEYSDDYVKDLHKILDEHKIEYPDYEEVNHEYFIQPSYRKPRLGDGTGEAI